MTAPPSPYWDGARNLADLGGLPLKDGGLTRRGIVFRSAAPEWMTDEGWAAARDAGLTRILDLRNAPERGRRPDHPALGEHARVGVEVIEVPTEDPDDPTFLAQCGPWLDHPRSWAPNMALYPDRFARVFAAIATAPGPMLIHCAGGRDRTGMVCSMLLALAGATPDAICHNYEAGFRGAAGHRGHGLAYDPVAGRWTATTEPRRTPDALDRALAERLPVVREWIATSDVGRYLGTAGLTRPELDRLRALLH